MGVLPPAQAQGGLSQAALPPQGEAAPQAPLSETPEGGNNGYTGPVVHDGQKIQVKNGMAEFDGQLYFISDDGAFVVDREHHIVGRVVNGQFIPIDDQYLAELQAKGMLEDVA